MNHPVHHITDAKLHGMYSMRKQSICKFASGTRSPKRGQGRNPFDELSGVAADLFGILKTGALAVPLNFRYSADEIKYCVELADVDILVFGPEFIGRVEEAADEIGKHRLLYYVGDGCPALPRITPCTLPTAPASPPKLM